MANGTWRIARGRGSAQRPLAIFAVFAIVIVLLGRTQSPLLDRARALFSDWTAPVLEVLRKPVDEAGKWVAGLGNVFVVYQENMRLKEQNARLRQWQNAALVLEQRLHRYQLLLNAVPDPDVASITAHVIGRANRPFLNTMILDAGKKQGVKPGEAAVDARGMIGRIFLAGDHTSWVVLLTDLNSRIPVAIQPGNIQAILAGDNTPAPPLEAAPQSVQLKNGDQIVTSGDGALLPAGLPIGVVYWDGTTFRGALFADADTSEDVRVLDLKTTVEQPPAPSPNDLPVAAAGLAPLVPPRTAPPSTVNAVVLPTPKPQALNSQTGAAKAKTPDASVKPTTPESPDDPGDNQ